MILRGFDDLHRKLKKLPEAAYREVLGRATDAGAQIVRDAARARAPRETGRLYRSIQSERSSTAKTRVVSQAGVRSDAFYAHMVEYGTAERMTSNIGAPGTRLRRGARARPAHYRNKPRGSGPAKPFMRPAFDVNSERIVWVMGEVLKREIERVVR